MSAASLQDSLQYFSPSATAHRQAGWAHFVTLSVAIWNTSFPMATAIQGPYMPLTFRWSARILFIDTDASGRIHYTSLFRYFEAAEIEFFRSIGVLHTHPQVPFPRVHVECDYRGAILYDDLLVFELSVGRLGNTSMQLKIRVLKNEVEVASGNVVIVGMERGTERATAIPDHVREKLQPYLSP